MKIQILRNLGRDLPDYLEGQIVEVADDVAQELIGRGLAVPKQKLRGVPAEPAKAIPPEEVEGSVEEAEADVKAYKAKVTAEKDKQQRKK